MDSVRLWFRATRPFSFTASVVPVVVGTLLAAQFDFTWWKALFALAGAVAIHAGTNLVNDYYDHVKGADNKESLGPAGLIQRDILQPRQVLLAGILCFAAGSVLGIILVATTGIDLLWLGLASVLAGFLYTGAPAHLAYIGLGELTVFVFMGPVMVMGAYYVQVETWSSDAFVLSLPVAFLVTAILHANNLRDIENDRAVGKRTLATLIGREGGRWEMYILLGGAYVSLVLGVIFGATPWPALLALITAPLTIPIVRVVSEGGSPRKLNLALFGAAQLHMRFGAVLAVGLGAWLVVD